MRLPVLTYPHPCLLKPAEPVTLLDNTVLQLVQDMFETMQAEHGVGLAAPQVGHSLQIVVMHIPDTEKNWCLINPTITARSLSTEQMTEGCLSFPQLQLSIVRHTEITVSYRDEQFAPQTLEASGLAAQCIQHELEHLRGDVFINRLSPTKRKLTLLRYMKKNHLPHDNQ